MGLSICPSVDIGALRPLPSASWLVRADCSFRLPEGFRSVQYSGAAFGSELPRSVLVPSLSFLPTSTVFSARHVAGFLRPAADHGVRRVSGSGSHASRSTHEELSARPVARSRCGELCRRRYFGIRSASPRRCFPFALHSFWLARPLVPFPATLHPSELSPRRNPCHVTVVDTLSPLAAVVLPPTRIR